VIGALAVVLGIATGVGVSAVSSAADAPPPTASFTAADFVWNASGSTGNQANIAPGGTVTFSYPAGASDHNADFTGGPSPTTCTQSAGVDSGAVPPLPHQPTAPGWSGTCTFDTPGTYTFHCDMHPFMTGTVVVGDATTTTGGSTSTQSTTTQTTTSSTPTTSPPPTITPAPPSSHRRASPLAGPARRALVLAAVQHGLTVHGSVSISAAGRGGRAEIQLFAAGGRRVGSLVRRALPAGRVRFAVALDRRGRRALRRQGQLALTVTVIVTTGEGTRASVSRRVRLRT
jgi:plastocyanin